MLPGNMAAEGTGGGLSALLVALFALARAILRAAMATAVPGFAT